MFRVYYRTSIDGPMSFHRVFPTQGEAEENARDAAKKNIGLEFIVMGKLFSVKEEKKYAAVYN